MIITLTIAQRCVLLIAVLHHLVQESVRNHYLLKSSGKKKTESIFYYFYLFISIKLYHARLHQNWNLMLPFHAIKLTFLQCFLRTVSSGISGASYYTGTFNTVNRSPDGSYVAVSSRGNFYLTWEPGQVSCYLDTYLTQPPNLQAPCVSVVIHPL